ncbi:hypothetical protein [Aureispira sp. CCB-E]|uniref:hypothetical protein n=1 Tax=Aureispira sp. CCB-E TaxID=3051121 RepID=UPI00286861EC|nr:hypothetical protein [Aureispira sp. CCB-E]WMX13941.1 hypothetical protein QP953_24100 [Aureispira sp. CCB-E]
MSAKTLYYGSILVLGVGYFIFLQNKLQAKKLQEKNLYEVSQQEPLWDESVELEYTSRKEELSDWANQMSWNERMKQKHTSFICATCGAKGERVQIVLLSNAEFMILLRTKDSEEIYAHGEIIKSYSDSTIRYVLEAPVYSKEEGISLQQYNFSGRFYQNDGKRIEDWNTFEEDSRTVEQVMDVSWNSNFDTPSSYLERWVFEEHKKGWKNAWTGELYQKIVSGHKKL